MRNSGRTFRTLLRVLNYASAGNTVVHVVTNSDLALWTFRRALDLCRSYMTDDSLIIAHTTRKICFPNGGSVKFMHNGQLVPKVVDDFEIDMEIGLNIDEEFYNQLIIARERAKNARKNS